MTTTLEDLMAAMEKDASLLEARIGKLFVLAGMMGMSPLEMIMAAQHFMAFGTFQLKVPPEHPLVEKTIQTVSAAMAALIQKNVQLDPIMWAANAATAVLRGGSAPVTLNHVDAKPTATVPEPKTGWHTLV